MATIKKSGGRVSAADRSNNNRYLPGPRRFLCRRKASPTSGTLNAETTEEVSGLGRNARPIRSTIALTVFILDEMPCPSAQSSSLQRLTLTSTSTLETEIFQFEKI